MGIDPISLGIQLALAGLSMAITASQHYEGPRVTDLKATVADYGTPLNNLKGRRVLNCPVFFAEDLVDRTRESKSKGGKRTTHYATGTCAVHVADHAITDIVRIWADEHLIYDRDGATTTFQFGEDFDLLEHMRFYLGTADQEADPRMLAWTEAKYGAGTCPAYRFQSYFLVEDVPFDLIGNRYPQWKVEAEALAYGEPTGWVTEWVVSLPTPLPPFSSADFANVGGENNFTLQYDASTPDGPIINTSVALSTIEAYDEWRYFRYSDLFGSYAGDPIALAYRYDSTLNTMTVRTWFGPYSFGGPIVFFPVGIQGRDLDPMDPLDFTVTQADNGGPAVALDVQTDLGRYEFSAGGVDYAGHQITWQALANDTYAIATLPTQPPRLRDFFNEWSAAGGLETTEYDYSDLDQEVLGFSWTQGTIKQIGGYLLDVYDSDVVPHDFKVIGKKRGSASLGTLATSEFVAANPRYALPYTSDRDLPRRIFFSFADYDADQNPNTATAQRLADATISAKELSVDAQALAMRPGEAKQSVDRYHRRTWFSRIAPEFSLTLQRLAIEPGDVWTPEFDGEEMTARAVKTTIGANGEINTEWALDDPVLAGLSGAEGAPADGHVPSVIFDPAATEAAVLDVPLLTDAHDQPTPFAYLAAGPGEDKAWSGAVFSHSDTGEADSFAFAWDSIASSGGATFGETSDALVEAEPWVWDNGDPLTVVIDSGTLTSTTEEAVLNNGTVNLCAVEGPDGWELMQFTTATLVAPLTYEITGRLRGVRGTEQHIAGHDAGDRFILLTVKIHTLGASEIGDTDSYIATSAGQIPSVGNAFEAEFNANAHRPYAAVNGTITDDGGDKLIDADRRTRIGGSALNGMDVPLGEASEAWEADIYDGATFKRTITGTSLPLTYLAADIATDAASSLIVYLYQMNPTLNLRGFPLAIPG